MSLEVKCGQCQAAFKCPEHLAGKRVKCRRCGAPIDVQMATAQSDAADPGWFLDAIGDLEASAASAPAELRKVAPEEKKQAVRTGSASAPFQQVERGASRAGPAVRAGGGSSTKPSFHPGWLFLFFHPAILLFLAGSFVMHEAARELRRTETENGVVWKNPEQASNSIARMHGQAGLFLGLGALLAVSSVLRLGERIQSLEPDERFVPLVGVGYTVIAIAAVLWLGEPGANPSPGLASTFATGALIVWILFLLILIMTAVAKAGFFGIVIIATPYVIFHLLFRRDALRHAIVAVMATAAASTALSRIVDAQELRAEAKAYIAANPRKGSPDNTLAQDGPVTRFEPVPEPPIDLEKLQPSPVDPGPAKPTPPQTQPTISRDLFPNQPVVKNGEVILPKPMSRLWSHELQFTEHGQKITEKDMRELLLFAKASRDHMAFEDKLGPPQRIGPFSILPPAEFEKTAISATVTRWHKPGADPAHNSITFTLYDRGSETMKDHIELRGTNVHVKFGSPKREEVVFDILHSVFQYSDQRGIRAFRIYALKPNDGESITRALYYVVDAKHVAVLVSSCVDSRSDGRQMMSTSMRSLWRP